MVSTDGSRRQDIADSLAGSDKTNWFINESMNGWKTEWDSVGANPSSLATPFTCPPG